MIGWRFWWNDVSDDFDDTDADPDSYNQNNMKNERDNSRYCTI